MARRNKPPPMPPKVPAKPGAGTPDTRSAPDPFTIVLPALAALGAISSIATINWAAQDKTTGQTRSKRKSAVVLRDIETCCLGLVEIFRRFKRHPDMFCGEGGTLASPLKFGVHGPRVTADKALTATQLINDVASMLVLASQNAFDVMAAIEDGDIDAPDDVFFGFGECQDNLNKLIQERATMKHSVDIGFAVAQKLLTLVAELKKYRRD